MKIKSPVLAALALTFSFGSAMHGQDKPATSAAMKVDHNHSTIGFAVPILGGLSK
jgi:hypothetical protein